MAALNFPSSPTNGQVFGNWIYSTSKGAWQAKPLEQTVAITSPTAPASPTNGDLWYNTNDGSTYIYYTDVDGSQWVEIKSDVTLSSTIGPRVDTLELRQGLVPISPTSVTISGGTASANQVGTVSFSGVTTLSLDNVFTTTYTNYRILLNAFPSGGTYVSYRLRAAGTDNSSAVYSTQILQAVSGAMSSPLESNQSTGHFGYFESYDQQAAVDIFNPKLAKTTRAISLSNRGRNGGGSVLFVQTYTSIFDGTNQFDGLTLIFASSTAGTITVYGYND